MIFLRSIVFNAAFYVNLIGLMLLGLPRLLGSREDSQNLVRLWARSTLWLLARICGTKLEFRGLEHIPRGACIVAAKHQSFIETVALTLHTADFTFVLKRELGAIPLFGWYVRKAEQIMIDRARRGSALAQLAREARKVLGQGRQIFIFPEGTRRPAGAPPAFKPGVAHLYAETNVPCVPVALNSGLFWPRRSFLRQPGTIVIEFLEPIAPGLDKRSFMRLLQDRIEPVTDRLIAEAIEADPRLRGVVERGGG
jgi:1-acyl-sn-glycerol-3-phosphate acyltransferase